MNAVKMQARNQAIKNRRLLKAFEGVQYNFFADWLDTDHLVERLLGTDIQKFYK